MYKKSIILLLVMCLLASVFVGCGKQEEADTPGEDDTVEITLWAGPEFKGVYSQDEENAKYGDFYKFAAKEYQKIHPNVKINVQIIPYTEIKEKLNVALQGGTQPDIYCDSSFVLIDRAYQGKLVPLDDVITPEDKEDIPENIWDMCQAKGKTYIYPFAGNPGFLGLNTELFKKVGAEKHIPSGTIGEWTPEEFKVALKALSKAKDFKPFVLFCGSSDADTWNNMYLRMFGADFFNEDGTEVILNSPEGVKALEFLKELANEKLIVPGPETLDSSDSVNLFANKQVAVAHVNYYLYNMFMADLAEGKISEPFDVKFAYFPNVDGPKCFTYVSGSAVLDSGDENRVKYAKDFVKFYSSLPYAKASKNLVPIREKVVEEVKDEIPMFEDLYLAYENAVDFNRSVPGYQEIRNLLFPELQAVFTNEKTPKQALDDFAEKANKALKKNIENSVL